MQKDLARRYQSWGEFSFDLADAFRAEHLAHRTEEVADSEKFNTLRGMPFFNEFSDAELWEVMRISSWENLPAGTTIMQDGDPGDFFCILASGEVKVTKRKKLLNVLTPGECFGEMAYIRGGELPRHATVESMTDVLVSEFETGRDWIRGIRRRWPFLSRQIARAARTHPQARGRLRRFDELTDPAK